MRNIWNEYYETGEIAEDGRITFNQNKTKQRIVCTEKCINDVNEFIRIQKCEGRRVVSRHVLNFLESKNYIFFNREDEKSYHSALRSVQRFLKRIGYQRGSKS